MNITIQNRRIAGSVRAVEYAPLVHRYLIALMLTEGHEMPLLRNDSDRVRATMACLTELRAPLLGEDASRHTCYLNCTDSKETFALILPLAAALGKYCEFSLEGELAAEPVSDLFKALKVHGIRHEYISDRTMRMWGRLTAGTYILPAEYGTSFLSGLLFALPLLKENSVIMINGELESVTDVVLTLKVLQEAGITVDAQINDPSAAREQQRKGNFVGAVFKIQGSQTYQLHEMPLIEGDWALASYFLTAGAVCGGPITVAGLNTNTLQKSRQMLGILKKAGALVEYGNEMSEEGKRGLFRSPRSRNISGIEYREEECDASYIRVTGSWTDPLDMGMFFQRERLHAFEADIRDVPELLPAAVLLATAAQGISCLKGIRWTSAYDAAYVRRIIEEMEQQGIMIWENEGDLYIEGYSGNQPLSGGLLNCRRDERIAMMEGIAACISGQPVTIEEADCVSRVYPGFYEDLMRLQE